MDFREALKVLLTSHDAEHRTAASRFLQTFQRSKEAWTVCVQALQTTSSQVTLQQQLFAAQTLRSKLHENLVGEKAVASEFLLELRNALFALAIRFSSASGTASLILTQILLSLSTLVVRIPEWKTENVCEDVVQHLQNAGALGAAAQFLHVLPEEILCKRLEVSKSRRYEITTTLRKPSSYTVVLKQLQALSLSIDMSNTTSEKNGGIELLIAIFGALNAWVDCMFYMNF